MERYLPRSTYPLNDLPTYPPVWSGNPGFPPRSSGDLFQPRLFFLFRRSAIAPPPNSSSHSLRDWQHLNRILHFTSFNCTFRSHETVLWSLRSCTLRLSSRGGGRRPLFPRIVGALFTASDNHRLGFHNVAVFLLTACSKCRPCVTFFFYDLCYTLLRPRPVQIFQGGHCRLRLRG